MGPFISDGFSSRQGVDFIGREGLLKHKENGIKKKVCLLTIETTDVDPEGNETIWFGGKVNTCRSLSLVFTHQQYFFELCTRLLWARKFFLRYGTTVRNFHLIISLTGF